MESQKMTKEQALQLIHSGSESLKYLHAEFRNDREIVMAAIKNSYTNLQYASKELQNDREIVLAAIKESGSALEYASEELRNDRLFVLPLIKNKPEILQYASEELRSDIAFLKPLIKDSYKIWDYVSNALRNDKLIYFKFFKPYNICINAGDLVLKAEGPLVRLNGENGKSEGWAAYHSKTKGLKLRVENLDGEILTPIIKEIIIEECYSKWTSYYNNLEAGYLIFDNQIFFRSTDTYDNDSSENIGLNKILLDKKTVCSLEELKRFLQPCEPITDEDKVVMLHKFIPQIMDFQQHYEVSEINKDKMNWDGKTLTIHA